MSGQCFWRRRLCGGGQRREYGGSGRRRDGPGRDGLDGKAGWEALYGHRRDFRRIQVRYRRFLTLDSTVEQGVPTENGQTNFGAGYDGQWGMRENRIEVCVDGSWHIFAWQENDLEDVSLTVSSAAALSAEIQIENQSEQDLSYGESYSLEVFEEETATWMPLMERGEISCTIWLMKCLQELRPARRWTGRIGMDSCLRELTDREADLCGTGGCRNGRAYPDGGIFCDSLKPVISGGEEET